jgi:hypothetical protein
MRAVEVEFDTFPASNADPPVPDGRRRVVCDRHDFATPNTAAISRYKRVIGDTLKSRHDTRRATEVAIAIKSLKRTNQLGRAIFTRIA